MTVAMASSKAEVQDRDFVTRMKHGSPTEDRDSNMTVKIPSVTNCDEEKTRTVAEDEEEKWLSSPAMDSEPTDLSVKKHSSSNNNKKNHTNNNNNNLDMKPPNPGGLSGINNNHINLSPSLAIKSSFSITNLLRPPTKTTKTEEVPEDLSRAGRNASPLPEVTITPHQRLPLEAKKAMKRKIDEVEQEIDVVEEEGEEDCEEEEEEEEEGDVAEDSGISETLLNDETIGKRNLLETNVYSICNFSRPQETRGHEGVINNALPIACNS